MWTTASARIDLAAGAATQSNLRLRSLLSGHIGRFYRHKPGVRCGAKKESIGRNAYEQDFFRLIQLLEVKPEAAETMADLASQITTTAAEEKDAKAHDEAIALCKREIQAAVDLYGDGRISREEYLRRVERNDEGHLSLAGTYQ